jgi:hypothetical protein
MHDVENPRCMTLEFNDIWRWKSSTYDDGIHELRRWTYDVGNPRPMTLKIHHIWSWKSSTYEVKNPRYIMLEIHNVWRWKSTIYGVGNPRPMTLEMLDIRRWKSTIYDGANPRHMTFEMLDIWRWKSTIYDVANPRHMTFEIQIMYLSNVFFIYRKPAVSELNRRYITSQFNCSSNKNIYISNLVHTTHLRCIRCAYKDGTKIVWYDDIYIY